MAPASGVETPFAGGCACGAIRYECLAAPLRMLNCHCRDCQIASGSAFSPSLIMASAAVNITKGRPAHFEKTADSGNIAKRAFCRDCGTPLFASSSASPGHLVVRAASLDDPSWFRPEENVWVGSAQPWDHLDPEIPGFERNRPRRDF
ncbi:MAG: GFA family protein [Usitatibacter sp.]